METVLDVFGLVVGGVLLYLGAEWLVKGSAGLARAFGVKPLIVGLTVVAYGTSAPELAVSTSAILSDSSQIVMGNVLGSCVANIALILGITALISPPAVDGRLIRRELPILMISVIAVPVVMLGGQIGRIEAGVLLAGAIAFTLYTLFVSSNDDSPDAQFDGSASEAAGESLENPLDEDDEEEGSNKRTILVLLTVVGLGLLVAGGELFVNGAKGIAMALGVSESVVGLTIVAIGTSLPELAASIVAAARGYSSLAVGNVVGSNIFNVFLIFGVVGSIRPIDVDLSSMAIYVAFLIGITIIGILFMRGERRINRTEGLFLLATYIAFLGIVAAGYAPKL